MAEEFRILNPRLDANFKAIFTQNTDSSRKALKSFLTAAIGQKVTAVSVKENDDAKQFDYQRGISYDINCTFDDESSAQIEMQGYDREYDYGKRAEYYAARLASSSMEVGDDWSKVPKAFQISVLNFVYDETNANPVHHYTMQDKSDGAKLSGILNVIFMELPKLPEINENTDIQTLPSSIKWCKFFKDADNPKKQDFINELVKTEEGLMEAENTLKNISSDRWRWIIQGQIEGRERDIRSGYIAFREKGLREGREEGLREGRKEGLQEGREEGRKEGLQEGRKEGLQQGLQQGKNEAARSTARNFLAETNLSPEKIAQCCSLPLEEVLGIRDELNKSN